VGSDFGRIGGVGESRLSDMGLDRAPGVGEAGEEGRGRGGRVGIRVGSAGQ
jgi:hypothetical protein